MIKFGITSSAGLLINMSILVFLVEVIKTPEWLDGTVSIFLTPVIIFPFVNNWVFNLDIWKTDIATQLQRSFVFN